jgi:hypothetical protein
MSRRRAHQVVQPPRTTFRRKVAPFDDVEVDVDVEEVLEDFHGVRPYGLHEINSWIASGAALLDVASPQHYLPSRLLKSMDHRWFTEDFGAGTPEHRRLCAIAAFYLMITRGKGITYGGTGSGCGYTGGWADVSMLDGSLFIECGTLRADKLHRALEEGETLTVIPYRYGCKISESALNKLCFEPDMSIGYESLSEKQRNSIRELDRRESIVLAYTFTPISVPNTFLERARKALDENGVY